MDYTILTDFLASPPLKQKIDFSKIMFSVFLQHYHSIGKRDCWPRLHCSIFQCIHPKQESMSQSGIGVERNLSHPVRDLIRCYSLLRWQYIPLKKDKHTTPEQNELPRGKDGLCFQVPVTQK
jgi:hypothetical protein